VVTAALLDEGPDGTWSAATIDAARLVVPHVMPSEVANVLRRAEASGQVGRDVAALALADLLALPATYLPFAPFAERCWELRGAVSAYDAWYVAIAEHVGAPLATLDRRLTRAPGPRARFLLPTS
jgi:predicted nucleic acid-binding protein